MARCSSLTLEGSNPRVGGIRGLPCVRSGTVKRAPDTAALLHSLHEAAARHPADSLSAEVFFFLFPSLTASLCALFSRFAAAVCALFDVYRLFLLTATGLHHMNGIIPTRATQTQMWWKTILLY